MQLWSKKAGLYLKLAAQFGSTTHVVLVLKAKKAKIEEVMKNY